ncbi:MAG: ABC transporter substrate-binding protein [Alphaproteobacteria bacterium]|nr:ABC transporter substrate-binding protein [Alphaproteobacteria bacterium]
MRIGRRQVLQGIAAASALGAGTRRARAQAPDAVTLRLNAIAYGEHAPFALGVQNGFFEAERIALKLVQGNGSGTTVQIVASKQDTFGQADMSAVMKAVAKGVPVRMIGQFQQVSALSIISFADKGFKTPKDLEGHSIALTAGDSLHQLLPAVFKKNGVDAKKVRLLFMDIAAKSTAVVDGKVDAMGGYFTTQGPQIAAVANKPTAWLKYADFGVNTVAGGVLAHNDLLKEKPDLVRRFLRASVKAWSYAEQHPEEAAAALVKQFPDSSFIAKPGQALTQWQGHLTLMRSPRAKGKEPGWVAAEDVQETIDLLAEYAELSPKGAVKDYVTNEFLPG